jgi:trans-aconitate 2-methyltransferase
MHDPRRREDRPAYTFGDGDLAAQRLGLVAAAFEEPTRRLLKSVVASPPRVALDLGCGPGYTTRLVADTTGAARVIGIDMSAAFIDLARAARHARCEFEIRDVLAELGHPDADLVFCRLLLAHLPDPPLVVAGWASQLGAGALIVLDEVESMDAPAPALEQYESLVVELVESRGALMYAGPVLGAMPDRGWRRAHDAVVTWPVPVRDAAAMYRMNLATWRHDPVVRARHDDAELDAVDALLAVLTAEGDGVVTWQLRQMALEVLDRGSTT